MPDDTIFTDTALPSVDPDKDYFAELTKPGAKFHSENEDEAKKAVGRGKFEADLYIARLEEEQKLLRDELKTRINYEALVDKLDAFTKRSNVDNQSNEEPPEDKSAMSPEQIEQLLEQKLRQRESQSTASQNLTLVKTRLTEVLGPNYAQRLKEQAAQLGVTEQFLNELAATQPKAFFRMLNVEDTRRLDSPMSPPRTQVSGGFSPTVVKKGKSYYDNIRKTDKNLYWTPKIQNEIFATAEAMGVEEFNKS